MRIDGETAWLSALSNKHSKWDAKRFSNDVIDLEHSPKFSLDKKNQFFCIGSCFARNIEEHLIYRDIGVLSKAIVCPQKEWPYRPNGITNKFTTASMLNEFEWISGRNWPEASLLETSNGWLDLQLTPGQNPVSHERAVERRQYLISDYFNRIRASDVLIITLGFIETWYDAETGLYLNATPPLWQIRNQPGRFQFERTEFTANLGALESIHDRYLALNPAGKIIVTVSPVPLDRTFSGEDIATANSYSKSILRSAAQTFANNHPNVDYFPSYELVTLSQRSSVYSSHDCLHVTDQRVSEIISFFIQTHIGDTDRRDPEFIELFYLEANPDVYELVRQGAYASGYEHWTRLGKDQNRPLLPERAPEWMTHGGISNQRKQD